MAVMAVVAVVAVMAVVAMMAAAAAVVTLVVMAEVMTVVGCLLSRILCSQLTFVSFQDLALVDCPSRRPSTRSVP